MSVHRFNRAIARSPAATAARGLRAVDRGAPDIGALRAEHAAYLAALADCGVAVDLLPEDPDHPDSLFVEDPALVFPEGAILLRPGAPSRFGEAARLAPALGECFPQVLRMQGPGHADGGDVLVAPSAVHIGLSARTDARGAAELAALLARLGRAAVIVRPPAGALHLKTACAMLDDETVLTTAELAAADLFTGLGRVIVPEGEEAVANALRVNDAVLIAEGFPRTAALLAARGHAVRALKLDEAMKLDAGLSCMSLRWFDPRRAA
jgi:dimethylargininase